MSKLIRDMIPLIAMSDGVQLDIRSANDEEFMFYLKEKLREETEELIEAIGSGDRDHIREELADVYEVLKTVSDQYRIGSLEDIARHRRSARGAYNNRTLLDGE